MKEQQLDKKTYQYLFTFLIIIAAMNVLGLAIALTAYEEIYIDVVAVGVISLLYFVTMIFLVRRNYKVKMSPIYLYILLTLSVIDFIYNFIAATNGVPFSYALALLYGFISVIIVMNLFVLPRQAAALEQARKQAEAKQAEKASNETESKEDDSKKA